MEMLLCKTQAVSCFELTDSMCICDKVNTEVCKVTFCNIDIFIILLFVTWSSHEVFTVWLGCTPEQLCSFGLDPSGQIGDTDTEYLPTALSSTEMKTSTSDNNLWTQGGREEGVEKKHKRMQIMGIKEALEFKISMGIICTTVK